MGLKAGPGAAAPKQNPIFTRNTGGYAHLLQARQRSLVPIHREWGREEAGGPFHLGPKGRKRRLLGMFSDSYFLPQFWWIIGNTSGSMVKLEAYSAPGEGACSTYARRFFLFFWGRFFLPAACVADARTKLYSSSAHTALTLSIPPDLRWHLQAWRNGSDAKPFLAFFGGTACGSG